MYRTVIHWNDDVSAASRFTAKNHESSNSFSSRSLKIPNGSQFGLARHRWVSVRDIDCGRIYYRLRKANAAFLYACTGRTNEYRAQHRHKSLSYRFCRRCDTDMYKSISVLLLFLYVERNIQTFLFYSILFLDDRKTPLFHHVYTMFLYLVL